MDATTKRQTGQRILAGNKTDDQKLFEVFDLYKEDLHEKCPNLYYALLGWKNAHIRELEFPTDNAISASNYFK